MTVKEADEELERIKNYVDAQASQISKTYQNGVYTDPLSGNKYLISFEVVRSKIEKINNIENK